MIPLFNADGLLPSDADATLAELAASILVHGPSGAGPGWDQKWREQLVANLNVVAGRFWATGMVQELWIDGSFVERCDAPGDVDGYFVLHSPRDWASGAFQARLNALEGQALWDWDPSRRVLFPGSSVPKPPFWGRYRVELFPEFGRAAGIPGPAGQNLTFAQGFRQQRGTFRSKGIVRLHP
jgi:hypothetical protein